MVDGIFGEGQLPPTHHPTSAPSPRSPPGAKGREMDAQTSRVAVG